METEFELIGLPDVPRIALDYPPLVLALCQIRFSNVLGVADPKVVAPFQRALQEKYPMAKPFQDGGMLQPGGEAEMKQTRLAYQFTDRDDVWKVLLAQNALAIETRAYEHFNDFLERLREAVDALVQHIQPTFGTRIGLRYINEIRPENMHWPYVIRQELLGPMAVPTFIENTVQIGSIQQLLLRYPEEQGINIHHGFVPGGTTVRPRRGEMLQDKEFYLLDFDVFRDFPPSRALLMDSETICRYVEAYHKVIYRLFRWSVTDQYLATLRR